MRSEAAQQTGSIDPGVVLAIGDELPVGFEHQPQYDVVLEEASLIRSYRFYTRGDPEIPTADHASILVGIEIAPSLEDAAREFHDLIASWSRMGYRLSTLDDGPGDEALAGWDGVRAGDEPKGGALVLARFGRISAVVQWVDEPGEFTLGDVVTIARLLEARAYTAQSDDWD